MHIIIIITIIFIFIIIMIVIIVAFIIIIIIIIVAFIIIIIIIVINIFIYSWIISYIKNFTHLQDEFNPILPSVPFLYPMKTSENHFEGVQNRNLEKKWVNKPRVLET